MVNEIEQKRKELEKGCNRNSALLGVNCGQQYEENYDIYYCNRCENKLEGFNIGIEMARKEFLENIKNKQMEIQEAINKYGDAEAKSVCSREIIVLEELKQKLGEDKR